MNDEIAPAFLETKRLTGFQRSKNWATSMLTKSFSCEDVHKVHNELDILIALLRTYEREKSEISKG